MHASYQKGQNQGQGQGLPEKPKSLTYRVIDALLLALMAAFIFAAITGCDAHQVDSRLTIEVDHVGT